MDRAEKKQRRRKRTRKQKKRKKKRKTRLISSQKRTGTKELNFEDTESVQSKITRRNISQDD